MAVVKNLLSREIVGTNVPRITSDALGEVKNAVATYASKARANHLKTFSIRE